MQHDLVYKEYEKKFPQFSKHTKEWFPNGKDSIRVRIYGGSDFVFTYHSWMNWKFETVESFIETLKGENKMC